MNNDAFELGDKVPRRGNWLTKIIARKLYKSLGWRVVGKLPNTKKFVIVVAPHTSNRDWFIGVVLLYALGLRSSWLAKHTLFWWPQSTLFNWLDGLAVDRTSANGIVEQVVQYFQDKQELVVAITPEGTRKKPSPWRSGFYYIADGAGVPMVLLAMDHRQKCISIGPTYKAEGGPEKIIIEIQSRLRDTVDCYDKLVNP